MTTCPVCGKPVDETNAPVTEYKGKHYYFACTGCKARFDEDPEFYLATGSRAHSGGHAHHHH